MRKAGSGQRPSNRPGARHSGQKTGQKTGQTRGQRSGETSDQRRPADSQGRATKSGHGAGRDGGGHRPREEREAGKAVFGKSRPARRGTGDATGSGADHTSARGKGARDPRREEGSAAAAAAYHPSTNQLPSRPRPEEPMRIAKAMARAGLCSRREAERWIEEGRVAVNGATLRSPARDVGPNDRIVVDGRPLPEAEAVRLWRYYKPKGLVTTHRDPEGRPTVFDSLPPDLPRVVSVGRLDFNTEGLLLLTNDGELARHMELPATGWTRRYRVRAHGQVTQADLDALKNGVEVDGVRYGPVEATLDRVQGANVWLSIGLKEGKNREVRNILGKLGLDVNRLIRTSYGPFQLLELEPGGIEQVKRRVLADQVGRQLAERFGLKDGEVEQQARRDRQRGVARASRAGSDEDDA